MPNRPRGFSLIELLMALVIMLAIGVISFQIFQQNERVFRDQSLITEMQQSARLVASQIADEVRMAGQGVPIYGSIFDSAPAEGVVAILTTSTGSRIDFRAGLSNVETNVTTSVPIDCTLGTSQTLAVQDASLFPAGKFIYIWGPANDATWAWVRAELTQTTANTLTLIPGQAGDGGHLGDVIRFAKPPAVSLEEVVSFYLSGNTVKRATATDMTNLTSPAWSPANEIARGITSLSFTYYDSSNNVVMPTSLANRAAIARVDLGVVAQTSGPLSDGSKPSYALAVRIVPRNLRIR